MKSSIRLVSTSEMSQEQWLQYRKKGIGASEVGVIMGLSPYKASIQLFYEKIGQELGYNTENLSMFLGKEQESFIASLWEHWDPNLPEQAAMIANYRSGNKVRRCKRVNAYAHNEKYPWLFVSLDREINQHDGKGNGALEIKTIGGHEADKWSSGLPPVYVVQVQTQMLVCEFAYGEIAILRDNRDFSVLPFDFNQSIADGILETTEKFWRKVEQAKRIVTQQFEAQHNFNYKVVEELTAQLQTLEPEPDGSDEFNNFLKEKYRIALPGERIGSITQLTDAQAHKEMSSRIKELTEQKQLHENKLKNDFGHEDCDRFDFGENGYVSWKSDSNGVRRFLNKTK